ncbi:MAG: LLM class flavin-dependent oxidoreductase [Bacteroidia bacterium]|nr:LLM class flavin-dependent oxidoreductase [Bacteroidia bacterium]
MELGVSMFADIYLNPKTGERQPSEQRAKELLEEIKLADQVGLDVFGIGEHHRADYLVSSPELILAAAAPITKNIKLSSAVTVLSSSDPVRIYQNFATVDLLSGGRAEITAGRGSFIESFPLFGYNLNDYHELFEEKLDLLLKINKQSPITWNGKFRASLKNQEIFPRALQNEIPIWIAVGGTPESVQRAAKYGLPLVIAILGGDPRQFAPFFKYYKDEYNRNGHNTVDMQMGLHVHTFVGENKNVADFYYPYYSAQMARIGKERGWHGYSREQYDMSNSRDGALFVGEPSELVDKILMVQEMFGLTRFMAHMDVGAPPHKELMKSIELFGAKIAPEVRKALAKK